MTRSILERLTLVHPDLEIWWDSSPLVFSSWVRKMVGNAPPTEKELLEEQLNRIFNTTNPSESIIRGCTTNPPLSLTAVKTDPETWNGWIDQLIRSKKGLSRQEYSWLTYKEVIRRGAKMMLPIWESSGGKYGYISGQLDGQGNPRHFTQSDDKSTGFNARGGSC